jgi:ABC-type transport system involved in cytochrome bd biosynthesis fused ATPase/permease subunit
LKSIAGFISHLNEFLGEIVSSAKRIYLSSPTMNGDELGYVQEAFDNLMKGRTSFVVAHRLSTIRNASLILVMKDGKIIEQGTHEELLKEGGFYSHLYNSQFQAVS